MGRDRRPLELDAEQAKEVGTECGKAEAGTTDCWSHGSLWFLESMQVKTARNGHGRRLGSLYLPSVEDGGTKLRLEEQGFAKALKEKIDAIE